MEKNNIKELNQAERLNSRLNICMEAYTSKSKELHKINVYAYRKFKSILANVEHMKKLPAEKLQFVQDAMFAFEPNKETLESSDYLKETINCRTEQYIANFERDAVKYIKEISGILAEVWLLVNMAEEVDADIQEFLDIAFAGPEYSNFKSTLDSIDKTNIESIKDLYMNDPKLALSTLRDMVKDAYNTKGIEKEVVDNVNESEEEVIEDVLTFMEEIEEDTEDKNDNHKSNNSGSTSSSSTDYSTLTKVGLGIVGILALGYVGKKVYDHFNSDDVVIIDSDGLDFSSSFDSFTSSFDSFTSSFDNIKTEW